MATTHCDLPPDIWADLLEDQGQDTAALRACLSYSLTQFSKGNMYYRGMPIDQGAGVAFGYSHVVLWEVMEGKSPAGGIDGLAGYTDYVGVFNGELTVNEIARGYGSSNGYYPPPEFARR